MIVIDWDQVKIIDREGNRGDRWMKEAIHIRKEQDKSMNRDEGSYQLSHIYTTSCISPRLLALDVTNIVVPKICNYRSKIAFNYFTGKANTRNVSAV